MILLSSIFVDALKFIVPPTLIPRDDLTNPHVTCPPQALSPLAEDSPQAPPADSSPKSHAARGRHQSQV